MNKTIILWVLALSFNSYRINAQDLNIRFTIPDTLRAVQFLAEIKVNEMAPKADAFAGIRTDLVAVKLVHEKGRKEIRFSFPAGSSIVASGSNTKPFFAVKETERENLKWPYEWELNETHKLLISVASDSAENFSVYSGYIYLPKETKWKLIGSCKIAGRWSGLKEPALFHSFRKKSVVRLDNPTAWVQRSNGSWKNLHTTELPNPVVTVTNHVDSLEQVTLEKKYIESEIKDGKAGPLLQTEGIYYSILKEGTGRLVTVSDTVVAHYKGYLFTNGAVFDQTRENPATFPLRRLIRGWQIGVPFCKVGGKIKLVIPSGLGYSIRTRAAKIPPNSILVFEIEVVDVK